MARSFFLDGWLLSSVLHDILDRFLLGVVEAAEGVSSGIRGRERMLICGDMPGSWELA